MKQWLRIDVVLFFSAALLVVVSLLELYSMSVIGETNIFWKQLLYVGVGLAIVIVLTFMDYRAFQRYSTPVYFITLLVLLGTIVFGQTIRGTAGWIALGPFQIQPVEFAKMSLIIFLASFVSQKKTELDVWTRTIASAVLAGGMIILVLKQPDLGSSLILIAIWGGMLLASGIRTRHIVTLGILAVGMVGMTWFLLAPYQKDRIYNFISPERDPLGSGYNVIQALVAVGSGGLEGKGLGQGTQAQLNFLPEKHTDFIFAVISEELGLLGAVTVLVLYGFLLYRIERIGEESQDNFGYLIALGIFIWFLVQITINIGMNIGLLPVTGITAPLLSYGGSSLLSFAVALGFLGSIARQKQKKATFDMSLEKAFLEV